MEIIPSIPNELRLEGKFCDAGIKVDNVEFQVHKMVMSVFDTFFSDLFLRSSDNEPTDFTIEGVSQETMSQIIDFVYTGSVNLTNIFELMITANKLNITSLGQICPDILKDQLCPETCIGVLHFTNTNHFPNLQFEDFDFICGHFEEVALCEGFLQLVVKELEDILGCDDLNLSQKVTVYESVLRWINHSPEERQGTIATLLSKVRLGMMDMDYIRNIVSNNDLVKTNHESNLMVLQVTESQFRINNPLFRPCLPNAIILVLEGWSHDEGLSGIVEAYDFWTDKWIRVPMCNSVPELSYHCTVFLGKSVYIVGGCLLNTVLRFSNSMYMLNTDTHTWGEVCPMHQQRGYVSATVLNGCIYAMGGFDGDDDLSSAEYYRPKINQWTLIASMNDRRSKASCTTINNKTYICGGHNGIRTLKTAECYNPDTNQWTLITPMGTHRSGLGVIAYVDHIFAVGGEDDHTVLKSAEAYNPVTNTWHNAPEIIQSHSSFGIAVIKKRLFVVDGSTKVECYNSTTVSWSEVCSMEVSRWGPSCCVTFWTFQHGRVLCPS